MTPSPVSRSCREIALTIVALAIVFSPSAGQSNSRTEELTLAVAVDRALAYHPNARAALAGLNAANAAVGERTASRLPLILFEASATRYQEPMIVAPLHALDITRAPEFDRMLLRGTATMAYTLFDGGARGARITSARSEVSSARALQESAISGIIASVTNTYLRVLTYRDILMAHDRRLEALEAEHGRVTLLFEEGTAARVELLRVEAAIAQASAEQVNAETELEVAELSLARLTGVDPAHARADHLVPVILDDTATIADRETLLARADASSPELARARGNLEAARSMKRAASATWLPRVSVFGGYLGFSSAAGGLTTEWQAGAKLSYPIFTGGGRSAAIGRASALLDLAQAQSQQVTLAVQNGIDRAISANRGAVARETAAQQAVDHLSEVARIERLALEAGAGTQTDYLRAEAELLRSRAGLIEARYARITARIELARAVGELNPAWLDRVVETYP